MVNLADTDGNGTVDGSAAEWATGESSVSRMTADGSVVSGHAVDTTNTNRAYRWDAVTGMVNLADTSGDGTVDGTAAEWATGSAYAYKLSADGSVVIGGANDGTTRRAYRWDAVTGMVNLADTDGDGAVDGTPAEWATGESYAWNMNADGSVVIGYAQDADGVDRVFVYKVGEVDKNASMLDLVNTQTSVVQGALSQGSAAIVIANAVQAASQVELGVAPATSQVARVSSKSFNAQPQSLPIAIQVGAARSVNNEIGSVTVGTVAAAVRVSDALTFGAVVAPAGQMTDLSGYGITGDINSFGVFMRSSAPSADGLTWKASVARSGGDVTVARSAELSGTEAASGETHLASTAMNLELGMAVPGVAKANGYMRLSRTTTIRDGYTEDSSASFPITYADYTETVTTVAIGGDKAFDLSNADTLTFGLGFEADLNRSNATINGTSALPGMASFAMAAPEIVNANRAYASMGLQHDMSDGAAIKFNLGAAQSPYNKSVTRTAAVNYQVQF
jgi:hypothetical protein